MPSMGLRKERILAAQRIGLRNRIRDEWHVPEAEADALLVGWDDEARRRELAPDGATFWSDGAEWIRQHLDDRRSRGGAARR
jgi:hypothetical protein